LLHVTSTIRCSRRYSYTGGTTACADMSLECMRTRTSQRGPYLGLNLIDESPQSTSKSSIVNMEPTQEPLTCTKCARREKRVECALCEDMLYCSAACQAADLLVHSFFRASHETNANTKRASPTDTRASSWRRLSACSVAAPCAQKVSRRRAQHVTHVVASDIARPSAWTRIRKS
jgi:hypothetical protein